MILKSLSDLQKTDERAIGCKFTKWTAPKGMSLLKWAMWTTFDEMNQLWSTRLRKPLFTVPGTSCFPKKHMVWTCRQSAKHTNHLELELNANDCMSQPQLGKCLINETWGNYFSESDHKFVSNRRQSRCRDGPCALVEVGDCEIR